MRKIRCSTGLLPLVVCILLVVFVLFSQRQLDIRFGAKPSTEDLKYLPSGKFLKGVALSFDEIAADLLWIKAIAYFGEHAQADQDFTWLYHILDITTTLDPLYSDPYEFGGIVLATELGDIDKSIDILKKDDTHFAKEYASASSYQLI